MMTRNRCWWWRSLVLAMGLSGSMVLQAAEGTRVTSPSQAGVPGVVVAHSPKASGLYIGSPSIAILTNGDYLASHDFFGPKSAEHECARVTIHRSIDRGASWKPLTELKCLFWANLFVHRGAVYIMGTEKHHGRIVIRRSTDGGATWTEPKDERTGLLTAAGQYHTAPVPMVEHGGRLWRGFEDASNGTDWGKRYSAGVLSAPVEADLLEARNWTFSNFVSRNAEWLEGKFNAWLEGNAVVAPDGTLVDVLRVDTPGLPEKAAIVRVSEDGRRASFDEGTGFVDFPGGAKKFTIRFDKPTGLYWTLATVAQPKYAEKRKPASVRNRLVLMASRDLREWEQRWVLLEHEDVTKHGFQYVDWLFDGEDLAAVCRTAYDDGLGGANNNHDANFLTFHRVTNFRGK